MKATFRFFNGSVPITTRSDKELWQVHSAAAKRETHTRAVGGFQHEQAKQDYATTFGLLAARGIVVEPYPELSQPTDQFHDAMNMVAEGVVQIEHPLAEGQMYLFGVECENI